MATLAEIRAKLKEQESRTGGSQSSGGDNAIFPFWNMKEGEIRKHITQMARYITEGIIDVIE